MSDWDTDRMILLGDKDHEKEVIIDIKKLEQLMEEMAKQPREPHIRQPGEKGMYERQREENNA